MYGHTYSKSMDQPGKVANAARGHLISILCVFFPFILDVKFVWVYQSESHRRRSHKMSHPPFYDARLYFSRGRFIRSFPSSTVKSKFVYDLIVPHMLGISNLFKSQLPGFELTSQRPRRLRGPIYETAIRHRVSRWRLSVPRIPENSWASLLSYDARIYKLRHVRVCVFFFQIILGIKFVGCTSRGHTGGRSHKISHPPSFCGACLNFSREKDSGIPFPRRP